MPEVAAAAPPARPRRRRRVAALAAAFLGGVLLASAFAVPVLYPTETFAEWLRLRYGSVPSPEGVVLSLQPAPRGVTGPGRGPWVVVQYENVSDHPVGLFAIEEAGDELGFVALDADGRRVPTAIHPGDLRIARPIVRYELGPGERLGFPVDLRRWLAFPAAGGTYRVQVERVPLGHDRIRCRSGWLRVEVPAAPDAG